MASTSTSLDHSYACRMSADNVDNQVVIYDSLQHPTADEVDWMDTIEPLVDSMTDTTYSETVCTGTSESSSSPSVVTTSNFTDCGKLTSVNDTPWKIRYRQTINRLRVNLHRQKQKCLSALNKKVRSTSSSDIIRIVEQTRKYLPELTLNFVKSQMVASTCKRPQNMRWSDKDRLLALSMYFHGTKANKFISRIFKLPPIQSLRRWLRNTNMNPGFSH